MHLSVCLYRGHQLCVCLSICRERPCVCLSVVGVHVSVSLFVSLLWASVLRVSVCGGPCVCLSVYLGRPCVCLSVCYERPCICLPVYLGCSCVCLSVVDVHVSVYGCCGPAYICLSVCRERPCVCLSVLNVGVLSVCLSWTSVVSVYLSVVDVHVPIGLFVCLSVVDVCSVCLSLCLSVVDVSCVCQSVYLL